MNADNVLIYAQAFTLFAFGISFIVAAIALALKYNVVSIITDENALQEMWTSIDELRGLIASFSELYDDKEDALVKVFADLLKQSPENIVALIEKYIQEEQPDQ